MKKDLPIFDIIIDEEDLAQGVGRISLVDEPAIGVDWIALKRQPKMIMAKPECLGCPPNGDGTKANGEPDRRCKGDSANAGSTTTTSVGKIDISKNEQEITKIDERIKSLANEASNDEIQKWADKVENEFNIKPDDADRAARSFAEINRKQEISRLEQRKSELTSQIEVENWAKSLESELGISPDASVRILPTQGLLSEQEPKKQVLAKRECLGCPPNGDGTKANGEPDRRCKGDGSVRGTFASPKVPRTEATTNPKSFINDKLANSGLDREYGRNTKTPDGLSVGDPQTHIMSTPIKVSASDIEHINKNIESQVDDKGRKMYKTAKLSDGSIGVFRNNGTTMSNSLGGGPGMYSPRPMLVINNDEIRSIMPTRIQVGSKLEPTASSWGNSTNPRMKHLFDLLN